MQIAALRKRGCEKLFVEQASGRNTERPELAAALEFVRPGDALMCWRFDRLGRSVSHLLSLVGDLERRGVALVSLTEGIDTTTPGGRMVFTVFAALAAFERELISVRVSENARMRIAKGLPWGRGSKFRTRGEVEAAQALLRAGMSVPAAARQLGMARSTLYKYFPGGCADNFIGTLPPGRGRGAEPA